MKRLLPILALLLWLDTVQAQLIFKVSVPAQPVEEGISFQVQYILEDGGSNDDFITPDFRELRVINGPIINAGSMQTAGGAKKLKNILFTLEAARPGRYMIPAATATVNGISVKSNNAYIDVLNKKQISDRLKQERREAANEDYFLRPGEDPYEKIKENLFIKVAVNKKACYTGEPVIATYKLYSRLESKSDIVKNPGFYGFTVQDMINLNDQVLTTEMINGKSFDVHTIRKVQLFPLQAGSFLIDEMEVQNKVTFSRSFVQRKNEQEIEEGVYDHPADLPEVGNTVSFETSMRTEPVAIQVKPVPAINQPAEYGGATGNFQVTASLEKGELSKNEEGDLLITITGKGNFTQLSAPVIVWPKGIEGFDAIIKDELDKTQSPLTGKRIFRFPFTVAQPGNYLLPAIRFSFFNTDSNHYKTITTKPVNISIADSAGRQPLVNEKGKARSGNGYLWMIGGAIALAIATILWYIKRKNRVAPTPVIVAKEPVAVDELLQKARILLPADNKSFYTALRNGIRAFFADRFQAAGGGMSRQELKTLMQQKNIASTHQASLLDILGQCETGIFTNVESMGNKKELYELAKTALEEIDQQKS